MRLEPARISLSGRPAFLRAPAPVQTSAIAPELRKCMSCGMEDVLHAVPGIDGPRVEHSVTIELRYLQKPEELTPYLRSKGWRSKIHQGRPAMERFVCRPCMMGHELMEKEFRQKRANEKRSSGQAGDTYYMAVCGE